MCCFAARVERIKEARKSREELKKQKAKQKANESMDRKNRKSGTPIQQVVRDGNSFTNRAFVPEKNGRSTPQHSINPASVNPTFRELPESRYPTQDDRFEKSIYNGRIMSSALGRTIGSQSRIGASVYRIDKAETLMESSIDGFQTGEPSTASTESNSPRPPAVGPVATRQGQQIPLHTQENQNGEFGAKRYIPKGAVPSIGPNFTALINDVKDTQQRNRNLSGDNLERKTTVAFGMYMFWQEIHSVIKYLDFWF